jgi:hypothetical protein
MASILVLAPAMAVAPHASAETQVTVTGHGFGHGRGMGQWGAFGYATLFGWSYQQITDHYYGGTALGSRADAAIAVRLLALDGAAPTVTSGAPFTVGGWQVAAGSSAQIQLTPNGSWLLVTSFNACNFKPVWSAPITDPTAVSTVAGPGSDLSLMLSICESDGSHQYRGSVRAVDDGGTERAVNVVDMEQYVRAVVPRESPASWGSVPNGMEALKAQAVAARSYAWAENRWPYAKTCDSTFCQVYSGAGLNGAPLEDSRSDAATSATASQVRLIGGAVARTEFSSSTGGYSAGGTFPPTPDAGDIVSPYHNWNTTLTGSAIAAAYGVGTFGSVVVTGRNGLGDGGGRALTVAVSGSSGSVSTTGADFQARMGLRSDWFFFPAVPHTPLWLLRNSLTPGAADLSFGYGSSGDVPLTCHWQGTVGASTPAVFRNGLWYIRLSNTTGVADMVLAFGDPGDIPVCGDWDGNGTETPGIYRNGVFYLRNSLTTGGADVIIPFGNPGDVPLPGRWTVGAPTTIGVYRPANTTFYLRNKNSVGVADGVFQLGNLRDQPVMGDWNGDRIDTIGVFRSANATFYLFTTNAAGSPVITLPYGIPGDRPITGDWTRQGHDTVGVVR